MSIQNLKSKLDRDIFRYIVIGGFTQVIDFSSYAILSHFGIQYILANLIATPITTVFNYYGHKYFTFDQPKWKNFELGKYLLNLVFLAIISSAILYFLVEMVKLDPVISKIIQIFIITTINYLSLKKFVFLR